MIEAAVGWLARKKASESPLQLWNSSHTTGMRVSATAAATFETIPRGSARAAVVAVQNLMKSRRLMPLDSTRCRISSGIETGAGCCSLFIDLTSFARRRKTRTNAIFASFLVP